MIRGAFCRVLATVGLGLAVAAAGCSASGAKPPPTSPGPSSPSSSSATSGGGPTASTTPAAPTTAASTPPTAPKATVTYTQQNPGWALDRLDERRLPLDHHFITNGQGAGVRIYVVDGLFDVHNPELGGRASVGLKRGSACGLEDGINHGLFVAGLAAGRRTGVAKQAKIVSVGSSYGCEGGSDATEKQMVTRIVQALDWVADHAHRPALVNLSLNVHAPAPTVVKAVKRLISRGVTVVASAGNNGANACSYPPAGLPGVITVTGSTKSDRDAGLNYGKCVDLYAPALAVTSVVDKSLSPNRLAISESAATSWAAPLVSGGAALYLGAHPTATPAQVKSWLLSKATTGAIRGDRHGSPNRLLYVRGPL